MMYCVYSNTLLHLIIFYEVFLNDLTVDSRQRQETREVYDLHQGSHLHHRFYFRWCHSDAAHLFLWDSVTCFFITLNGVWCTDAHYVPLLRYFWEAKLLSYHVFHNSTVLSLQQNQQWGSTIRSQNTDTILHWCMPLTLLKRQVLLRKRIPAVWAYFIPQNV